MTSYGRVFRPHDRPPTRPRRAPSPPSPPELRAEGAQLFWTSSAASAADHWVRCSQPLNKGGIAAARADVGVCARSGGAHCSISGARGMP